MTTTSASMVVSSASRMRSTRRVALDAVNLHVRAEVDAVVAVYGRDHVAERGAEAAHHRMRECLRDGDVEPAAAAGGRDLGADEAGADHDDLRVRVELRAERERVVEGPEREHVREVRVDREATGRRPGGDDQAVEGDGFPGVEGHRRARRRRARSPGCPTASRERARRSRLRAARCRPAPPCPRAGPWRAAGGRTGGGVRPTIATMRPSYSPRRSVSAARSPASDIPTIAIVRDNRALGHVGDVVVCVRALPCSHTSLVALGGFAAGPLGPRARRGYASGAPLVSSEPDANVILAGRCPTRTRSSCMPDDHALDLDVSGRPLHLRDVDLDALPAPEDDRRDRRVRAVGEAEHGDDAEVRRVGDEARRDLLSGAPDLRDGARPQVLRVASTVPGDLDLAIILTGQRRRHVRGGPAAQGQVRGDLRGRLLRDRQGRRASSKRRLDDLVQIGDVRLLGPEHQPQRVRRLPRRPRRPVDRAHHAVGPPGPARLPGPGDRHPAHALGADRQRGRPRVRRLRRATSPTSPKSA